eukprot:SAG22_NODE_13366_length_409_cov_0.845161_2_plen_24_part_01
MDNGDVRVHDVLHVARILMCKLGP